MILSTLLALLAQASFNVAGKLFGVTFLENVLTRVIIWCGEKLAPMTSNNLDDGLVTDIKKALGKDE